MANKDADESVVVDEETNVSEQPPEEATDAPEVPQAPSQSTDTDSAEAEEQLEQSETPEEESETEEPPMSRRKAKRLEKLESLVERLRGQESPQAPKAEGLDYRKLIEADDAVIQNLEAKSQEYGQAQFNAGLEQAKSIQFQTRLEIDAPRVEAKYSIFDKESPDFDPAVTSSINNWFLASVGYDAQTGFVANPNVRYVDFVEGIMELADNMAGVKTTESVKNIAKQAATTGLRPDGSSARSMDLSKHPSEMTNEELEAAVKVSLPRDSRGRFAS